MTDPAAFASVTSQFAATPRWQVDSKTRIEHVSGVLECSVWQVTGSVLIRFDPELVSAAYLLQILDQARYASAHRRMRPRPAPRRPASDCQIRLSALAVAGEMAAPLLLPACAVLLVGSNLRTFRAAGRQLMRGQFGLPVLYTAIVAATLASGQFIASAAMSWMFTFWTRKYKNDLTNARRRLVGQIIQHPRYVRLATPRTESVNVEVAIDDLQPNDVILVSAGELIPTDGRVLDGRGLVDERMVWDSRACHANSPTTRSTPARPCGLAICRSR